MYKSIIVFKMSVLILTSCHSNYITFESKESKNIENNNVFNQIKLESTREQDTWYMNQSHHEKSFVTNYDQLKIVVNKRKGTTKYFQYKNNKAVPFSVKCTLCHSNGPRKITPTESSYNELTLKEKLIMALWNIKIKTYGNLKNTQEKLEFEDQNNETLNLKTCTQCHSNNSLFARGKLKRGNFLAIKYQLDNNLMPPWPYKISKKDKNKIKKFLMGFSIED